jgi:hypothetical protein
VRSYSIVEGIITEEPVDVPGLEREPGAAAPGAARALKLESPVDQSTFT